MTWLQRYRVRHYITNSIWILPLLGILAAFLLRVHKYGPASRRSMAGVLLAFLPTLFLLGLMLAHARLTTHSLWLPIGLHAGLVAAKMTFNKFTIHDRNLLPWFGPDLIGGASSALFLAGCWFLVWLLFLRETLAQRDLEYSR